MRVSDDKNTAITKQIPDKIVKAIFFCKLWGWKTNDNKEAKS